MTLALKVGQQWRIYSQMGWKVCTLKLVLKVQNQISNKEFLIYSFLLSVVAHNRYWGIDNIYAKENNGNYTFIIEQENKVKSLSWVDLSWCNYFEFRELFQRTQNFGETYLWMQLIGVLRFMNKIGRYKISID